MSTVSTWQQMLACPAFMHGVQSEYAVGLILSWYRDVEAIQHSGDVIGGACQMLRIPAQPLDIIIMANTSPQVEPVEQGYRIVDAVLGEQVLGQQPRSASRLTDHSTLPGWYASPDARDFYEIDTLDETLAIREMNGPPMSPFASRDAVATVFISGDELLLELQGNDRRRRYGVEPITDEMLKFVSIEALNPHSGTVSIDGWQAWARRFWLGNYSNRNVEFRRMSLPTGETQLSALLGLRRDFP